MEALGGELRSISPSGFVRGLRVATGVETLAGCARQLSRLILRAERRGEVRLAEGALHIREQRSILGRVLPERVTIVPVEQVVSISIFNRRAELLQTVGLGALAFGTMLGTGLLISGVRTAGFAPSLLGLGLALAAIGGAVDFALDRAAERAPERLRSTLRIVPTRGPGILLSGLPPASARSWLDAARGLVAEKSALELSAEPTG